MEVLLGSEALDSLQLPVLAVTQLLVPPRLKVPNTVAFATTNPVLTSRTLAVTTACQLVRYNLLEASKLLMAMFCLSTVDGSPLASEKASLLGDPVPTEVSRLGDALISTKETTAAGVACGLACNASAATPATWGDAIEVPLMVLVAVVLPIQAEVMLEPGAKISTQLP